MNRILAALLLTLLPAAASAEDAPLVLERPKDVSEEDWRATLKAFGPCREALAQTLVEAARKLPEPGAGPLAALRPRFQVSDVFERNASVLLDRLAPATACVLNDPGIEALVAPRLTGRVLRVGAGGEFATIGEALPKLQVGDVLRLGPGEHVALGDETGTVSGLPSDVWIQGDGAAKTSLRIFVNSARRVRFSGLTLLGSEDEIFSLNSATYLHLKDCVVREFNTRKGDFTAIRMASGFLLVDGCEFNGLDAAKEVDEEDRCGAGGLAIMGEEATVAVVRRTHFVDCDQVMILTGLGSLDGCTGKTTDHSSLCIGTHPTSRVYFRDCSGLYTDESPGLFPLPGAGSDAAVARAALQDVLPDIAGGLLQTMAADRNLSYWLGLTRHADAAIRDAASKRWTALTLGAADAPVAKPAPSAEALDQAVADLDAEAAATREKAASLLRDAGEAARDRLEAAATEGPAESRTRAASLLADLDRLASFGGELEFAKRAAWLEANAADLEWSEEKRAFEVKRR